MDLSILYRGALESCNYGCAYCPFAKKKDTRADLARDREGLERFVAWVSERRERMSVLVTPWGEALVRRWYQEALVTLSKMDHVDRAAIQTNLSCDLDWAERVSPGKIGIWATYHPEWTSRAKFVDKVARLRDRGLRVSCGVVGFSRFTDEIEALRADLPDDVYLWINAPKRYERVRAEIAARFEAVDPHYLLNTKEHPSLGKSCRAGASVVSVDEHGDVRRCHFIDTVIGNLYDGSFEACLAERPCTNATCGCHIGYVHLDDLELYSLFGGGILERIPAEATWKRRLAVV